MASTSAKRSAAGFINGEWNGAWSDGSEQWTPFWLHKLNYSFGKNGIFWMSFEDVCKYFTELDRTRLFNEEWTVVQRWAITGVAWMTGYLNTKFIVETKKGGPTVVVLRKVRVSSRGIPIETLMTPDSSMRGIS